MTAMGMSAETGFDPSTAFRLDGDVAVVTGAGSGLGRAFAHAFARAGARVVALDRDGASAARTAAGIGGDRAQWCEADVTDAAAIGAAFDRIAADHGGIDVLVNNAGIAIRRPTAELTRDDWQRVIDVNLTGVFLCCQAAARHMLKGDGGRIVNIASIMGLSGGGLYPNLSYQASKGGVVNLTRALAVEWARQGIRVNAVAPTWVRTELTKPLFAQPETIAAIERMTPMGRVAEVDDIVGATLFLAGRAASMITGQILAVDGGFLAQ